MSPALSTITAALVSATLVALQLGPSSQVAFVLQVAGLGALVGLLVAYRAQRRGLDADRRWVIVTRWTLALAALGAIAALADALHFL